VTPSCSQGRTGSRLSLAAPALGKGSRTSSSIATLPTSTCRRGRASSLSTSAAAAASPPSPSASFDSKRPSAKLRGPSCPNWHPLSAPAVWSGSEAEALDASTSSPPGAFASLSPSWKVLLLSDGSVTRHLQILTGKPVAVDLLEMGPIAGSDSGGGGGDGNSEEDEGDRGEEGHHQQRQNGASGLPSGAELLEGPLVQRRVLLRADEGRGEALVYAASWWNAGDAAAALDGAGSNASSSPSTSLSSPPSPSPPSLASSRQREQPIWTSLASARTELFREVRTVYLGGCPALERDLGARPGEELWGRHYLFWSAGKPLTVIYEVFSPRLREWLGG